MSVELCQRESAWHSNKNPGSTNSEQSLKIVNRRATVTVSTIVQYISGVLVLSEYVDLDRNTAVTLGHKEVDLR